MYSSSIFGVSFPDIIGQELSMHYDRKVALWQMKRQKEMAEWQAKNLPKLQREGLEAAGINPLLAYHSGVGSQSLPSAYAMPSHSGQLGGFDASAFQSAKRLWTNQIDDEDEQRDANIELTRKEIEKKDAEIESIKNQTGINSDVNDRDSILDWIRGILPTVGSALGAFWLGRKGRFSKTPKASNTPKTPKASNTPKTPKASNTPKTPKTFKTPTSSNLFGVGMMCADILEELNSAYGSEYIWNPLGDRIKSIYDWRINKARNQSLKRPRHKGNFKR